MPSANSWQGRAFFCSTALCRPSIPTWEMQISAASASRISPFGLAVRTVPQIRRRLDHALSFIMRWLSWVSWVSQLWHQIEPSERLDWILDTLGLRERTHQVIGVIIVGMVMLVYQKLADASMEWLILTVMFSIGFTYYTLNQPAQWQTHRGSRALAKGARPSISFLNRRRISKYIVTALIIIFMLSITKSPNGSNGHGPMEDQSRRLPELNLAVGQHRSYLCWRISHMCHFLFHTEPIRMSKYS